MRTKPSDLYANVCSWRQRTSPDYIRDKAREMRTERNLSIDEIAERLALPRTTVFYWVRATCRSTAAPARKPSRSSTARSPSRRNTAGCARRRTRRAARASTSWRYQDFDELQRFWGEQFGVEPERISLQPKTNSSQLASRTWRCVHGVLAVSVGDTLLRARLQAWMDRLRESWL